METNGTSALAVIEQPRLTLIPAETTSNSAMALAKLAASSGLCKTQKAADAFFVIMYGYELGIPAMTALRTIHVIGNTPVCSGEALLAIIRRSQKVDIKIEGTAMQATVWMRRRETGEEYTARWDIARGRAAGLYKDGAQGNWNKHPQAMMQWRGVSECSKFLCSDVTNGLYLLEEIAPDTPVNEDGEAVGEIIISKPEPEAPKTARECLQDGDCRKRFTTLLAELNITDDKPYLEALKVNRYSEYAGTFDELCQEMRDINETFNMPAPDPEDTPAIDPIVQQVAATITTEQAAESLAHKPGRISTDAPNWETDRSKLLALAAEACEKGWIASDGEAGIGEMEAMIAPQTWANYPTQFQAKQAIRAIYAEQLAQAAVDAHKPGNSSFTRGLDTYEAHQAQKDIDDANAEIDAAMMSSMERDD